MKWTAALILLLLAGGCVQLGGDAPPQQHHLLSSLGTESTASPSRSQLFVEPIIFPAYLDRPQIVTRSAQGELKIASSDRWAEPLEENLTRVLLENLRRQLPGLEVNFTPWQSPNHSGASLKLIINQFDGTLGQRLQVDIRWRLTDLKTLQTLAQRRFLQNSPIGGSYPELVNGLNQSLAELSQQIALALKNR